MKRCLLSSWLDKDTRKRVIHYLFPQVCMVCGKVLDDGCNSVTKLGNLGICITCLSKLPIRLPEERVMDCLSDPYDEDPIPDFQVWSLFHYDMPVTMLLRRLKFQNGEYCGEMLGKLMARELERDLPFHPDCVIPIPLSEKRLASRGYNQAAVLGGEIAKRLNIPLLEGALVRTRHTRQQSRYVEPGRRMENVASAFGVEETWEVEGLKILLIDDILTSGATLHEAARVLLEQKAGCVLGVTCASHRRTSRQKDEKDTKKSTKCH